MPIYHKSALRPRRDIYANAEERLVLRQAPSQMSVEFEEHKHLRTAAPTHMPLRRTLMWAASLPPDVRPNSPHASLRANCQPHRVNVGRSEVLPRLHGITVDRQARKPAGLPARCPSRVRGHPALPRHPLGMAIGRGTA